MLDYSFKYYVHPKDKVALNMALLNIIGKMKSLPFQIDYGFVQDAELHKYTIGLEKLPQIPDIEEFIGIVHKSIPNTPLIRLIPRQRHPALLNFLSYRNIKCEVCHTTVINNDIFILSVHKGNTTYVGRACLKYFFNEDQNDLASIKVYEHLLDALDLCAEASADSTQPRVEIGHLMELYVHHIGFDHNPLNAIPKVWEDIEHKTEIGFLGSTELTASVIINWGKDLQPTNDYEAHIKRLCNSNTIHRDRMDFLCSAYDAYFDSLRKQQQREYNQQYINSEHVGNMGEMTNFVDVEVLFIKEIESEDFGTSWLYKMQTSEGNVLTAFSRSSEFKPSVGDVINLRCKIKEHQIYEGIQQTMVSHVKTISREYAETGVPTLADKRSKKVDPEVAVFQQEIADRPIDEKLGF